MYGRNPRWSSAEVGERGAEGEADERAERRSPTAASFAVKSAASQRMSISSGPLRRDGSNSVPDDVVEVRHRAVVRLELADAEPGAPPRAP